MDIVERLLLDETAYDADDVDLHHDAADEIVRLRKKVNSLLNTIYNAGDLLDEDKLTATSNTLDEAKFKHNMEKEYA